MKMLLIISWRNVWRHPARSGVLLGAIIAGLWAGIVVSAWTNGMIEQRINRVIQEELTHIQIHDPEYQTEREPAMFVKRVDEIESVLKMDERVSGYTLRTKSDGIIQSPLTSSGVQITGVMTDKEREVTNFHENITHGEYLNHEVRNSILMGRGLAEKLNVEVGNRVVLSFQDLNQEFTSGSFNIVGLYYTGQPAFDEYKVYVRAEDLSGLLSEQQIYHEVAIMLYDSDLSSDVAADLNEQFDDSLAETWTELSPEMRYMTDSGGTYSFYVMVVIMFALAFGILNTMLMSIFERMRELGMLMAIGMGKAKVFIMIMTESVILTFTGAVAGMLLAYGTIEYFSERGFDLTAVGGDTMKEWGYDALVYPIVTGNEYFMIAILVIVTALLAAVYPAIKALRLNPGEVIRE
jgi:ABC-type lipoprotein release transport system permease subunit